MKREFWHGDCLELMRDIPDGSIDMVLCDLPYGTTQNKWDSVIPFEPLWEQYWRVLKRNGAVVLTAAQPFTSALVMSQIEYFKYDWIWRKSRASNVLNAKKMPLRDKEDILVFYKEQPLYFPQGLVPVNKRVGTGATKANQFGNNTGKIRQTDDGKYLQEFGNYPKQVIDFASEGGTIHPTQKPVALFEYLIKTYTNPGETVLDNCAGSGTTAIAAMNTGRGYICIERDDEYFRRATERVASHMI